MSNTLRLYRGALVCLCAAMIVLYTVPAQADSPDLSALAWLEGHWAADRDGVRNEEFWSSPDGGGLVGMHKDMRGGKMTSFEFLRITTRGDSAFYMASPAGRPPTPFYMVEHTKHRVVFANPAHDFPQRIIYQLDDEARLQVRVEGEVDGTMRSMEWIWERQKCEAGDDAR